MNNAKVSNAKLYKEQQLPTKPINIQHKMIHTKKTVKLKIQLSGLHNKRLDISCNMITRKLLNEGNLIG